MSLNREKLKKISHKERKKRKGKQNHPFFFVHFAPFVANRFYPLIIGSFRPLALAVCLAIS